MNQRMENFLFIFFSVPFHFIWTIAQNLTQTFYECYTLFFVFLWFFVHFIHLFLFGLYKHAENINHIDWIATFPQVNNKRIFDGIFSTVSNLLSVDIFNSSECEWRKARQNECKNLYFVFIFFIENSQRFIISFLHQRIQQMPFIFVVIRFIFFSNQRKNRLRMRGRRRREWERSNHLNSFLFWFIL